VTVTITHTELLLDRIQQLMDALMSWHKARYTHFERNYSLVEGTERENFYKWIESCPLTDYRICEATLTSVSYEFQFNTVEPDIDQLIDDVLNHLEK
jgi:hypothetical protein